MGYPDGAGTSWVEAEAVLVNTAKIEHLETASEEDIGLAKDIQVQIAIQPRAKDMTGA